MLACLPGIVDLLVFLEDQNVLQDRRSEAGVSQDIAHGIQFSHAREQVEIFEFDRRRAAVVSLDRLQMGRTDSRLCCRFSRPSQRASRIAERATAAVKTVVSVSDAP